MKKLILLCSTAMVAMPTAAFAQSTGSEVTETIVVTGRATQGVAGTVVPDVPKTRSVLTQDFIARQAEGQSILAITTNVPGVNYTNTDPYGGGNGNLRVRGFPGNRVAFLWDGLPLNDTGNYAIFGGQQMDPELIDQVSVNLGTTDVDSPTPSAAGGVISYKTRVPSKDMRVKLKGSIGSFQFKRAMAMFDTGEFTSFGTRAFIEGSRQVSSKFKGPGDLKRTQINARIYQPLGDNGDFFSIAAHDNINRNHSYNSGLAGDYLVNRKFDNIGQCARDIPVNGQIDNDNSSSAVGSTIAGLAPSTCTNYYELRYNPSNTQNIRTSLKYTITPGLTFTADPSYFWTRATGGGTALIAENDDRLLGNSSTATGVDLNGDGDIIDTAVRNYSPSVTRTKRFTFLSSLIWEATPQHRFRVAYTFDRGRHRQTGAYGKLDGEGTPFDPYGGSLDDEHAIVSADGAKLQARNRLSYAILNQLSGEYFGRFLDNKLKVTLGVRAPWFKRELNQFCFTSNGTNTFGDTTTAAGGLSVTAGNPYCTNETNPVLPGATPTNPYAGKGTRYFDPFERTVKYSPILPSAGVSYDFGDTGHSVYASYGKNFSSPSTDSLYRSVVLNPNPEFTKSYELGYRFKAARVQAQVAAYYTNYQDRIVSASDQDPNSPTFGSTIDRNVGNALAKGVDGQISFKPNKDLSFYLFGSYTDTKIKDNIFRTATATASASPCPASVPVGQTCNVIDVLTKGAQFAETPRWQFGGRVQKQIKAVSMGVQAKYVGTRFSSDDNGRTISTNNSFGNTIGLPIYVTANNAPIPDGGPVNKNGITDDYTVVDFDLVYKLEDIGFKPGTLRFNVNNVFNKYYFGNITTVSTLASQPRYSVGAPRTVQVTLGLDF